MTGRLTRIAWAAAAIFAGLGGVACAGTVTERRQVAVEPALLDGYAGYYLLGEKAVLSVKRDGDHLTVQLGGQPAVPIFPESRTHFFATAVDAQFAFQADSSGQATGVILHQHGADIALPRVPAARAQGVEARTAAQIRAQTPTPGTEAAARRLDASIASGKPDYDAMSPALANATRAQLPKLQAYLSGLGPIEEVQFLGVNPQGADVYDVRHANGVAHWTVALAADGKVAGAFVMQGP